MQKPLLKQEAWRTGVGVEELYEDLALTRDYSLRFPEEEQKVNQSELCKLKALKKNLLSLLLFVYYIHVHCYSYHK